MYPEPGRFSSRLAFRGPGLYAESSTTNAFAVAPGLSWAGGCGHRQKAPGIRVVIGGGEIVEVFPGSPSAVWPPRPVNFSGRSQA